MLARDRVTKVREFQQLARLSEADGHLQQRLKQLLKLSKEKWDAACEHAKTAVQARARAGRGHLCRAESRGSGPGRVSGAPRLRPGVLELPPPGAVRAPRTLTVQMVCLHLACGAEGRRES